MPGSMSGSLKSMGPLAGVANSALGAWLAVTEALRRWLRTSRGADESRRDDSGRAAAIGRSNICIVSYDLQQSRKALTIASPQCAGLL